MKLEELKKLWDELGDIPINETDGIDEHFHLWAKGTDKEEIWIWFDDMCPNGIVQDLMSVDKKT